MKRRIEKADVLIIGSGGAGLRAAIELHDNKVDVLVVGKCKKREAHTSWARGGINAAFGNMDPKDNWKIHAADTIKDGGFINDPLGVRILCQQAPRAVRELTNWGTKFHREQNGKIAQRFFGAARYRRACFVGDHTGKEILNVLVNQVIKRKIRFKSQIYITSLLTNKGTVNGAIGIDIKNGKIVVFQTRIVVIAAGGASRVYKRSSSDFWDNTGDGTALACGVGAHCVDMEMFQFHPTGMVYPPRAEGILVTEAVRGEGGILLNSKGERFMRQYDPNRMELSSRDIVSRAIYAEIKKGRGTKHGGVWLDISHKSKSYLKKRLPEVVKNYQEFLGQDISKTKMEVAPTAHYSMGGILVDHKTGKTTVKNLYAIGEVTGRIHGGNRLGGNSLAEIIIFGRLTGLQIAKDIRKTGWTGLDDKQLDQRVLDMHNFLTNKGQNPIMLKRDLQTMMWDNVGVVRTSKQLKKALKGLDKFKSINLKVGNSLKMNEKLVAALDLNNMIPTCELIIKSALMRKESRCAHFRSDFPNTKPSWKKNIICIPTKTGVRLTTKKVVPIPAEIKKALAEDKIKEHLLE